MSEGTGGSEEHREERQRHLPPGTAVPVSPLAHDGLLQTLLRGGAQPAGRELGEGLRRAQEEWEAVEETQTGLGGPGAGAVPPISFDEALQHFQTAELSEHGKQTRAGGRGLAALLRFCRGPPRLRRALRGERDLALAMARCALDDGERVHLRILQTLYAALTCSRLGCPRYGAHWEELGFQGADPGTDLRGTGMLGLMQLLFFVTDPRTLPLAREIFQLSRRETQNFPFCLVSLNVTRVVLQALREGRLSRVCNRRRQVLPVLNELHAAAFLQLYRAWKGQRETLDGAGGLLRDLEFSAKTNPKQLLKSLEAYVRHREAAGGLREATPINESDFTGICDPHVELEGEPRLI